MIESLPERSGSQEPWSFEAFQPDALIGTTSLAFDEAVMKQWQALFGTVGSGSEVPMATIPLLIMCAFSAVVVPRPPGNLHISQQCHLYRLPIIGQRMTAHVVCSSKELRGERRIVQFSIDLIDAQTQGLLCTGLTTIFWAL